MHVRGSDSIGVCVMRYENPLDLLLKINKKYNVTVHGDPFDEEINKVPGYDPKSNIHDSVVIEFFLVAKGTIKEEIEVLCKQLGYIRLIDPLEFLHLVKKYKKYLHDTGDPNKIYLPSEPIRTQWQNKDGEWFFMEFRTELVIDRIFGEHSGEWENWCFVGVKSCNVFHERKYW